MLTSTSREGGSATREAERQAEVDAYGVVDTLEEEAYDDLTRLAAEVCQVPIALITFLDHDRNWFKSRIGMQQTQAPRESAFCEHLTMQNDEVLIVNDALTDPRFSDNPLVVGNPHIRFYVGAPLISRSGHTLGAICAIDTQPRELDAKQIDTLQFLSKQVMERLEERRRGLAATSPTSP